MKFIQGNLACVEGALKAGCDFFAGYPITPSTEIMAAMARRMPEMGRSFIQMEDEIASIAAVIGAAWSGARAMTATSGPGLTLMLENIGYAYATETPCVIVDIQRAGPGTGQATRPAQGDVMQARFGASGDYESITLAPWSAQEMFEMTARAFSLAQQYRMPVFVFADELVGHIYETVDTDRPVEEARTHPKSDAPPFGIAETCEMTPMPRFGTGRKLLVTGSTHDEWGYRCTTEPEVQGRLVERITKKVARDRTKLAETEAFNINDAEIALVSFGFSARSSHAAMTIARDKGRKVGLLRLKNLWPFPQDTIGKLGASVKKIIVVEMNRGMVRREVERFSAAEVIGCHKTTGDAIRPEEIVEAIENAHT